jgi:hypothetical protein
MPLSFIVSALTGFLWGGLLGAVHVSHFQVSTATSAVVGAVIGGSYSILIKPLRDTHWRSAGPIALCGLYFTGALFVATTGTIGEMTGSGLAAGVIRVPLAILTATITTLVGLTLTGYVIALWPLSFANHLLVWWCQRRRADIANPIH